MYQEHQKSVRGFNRLPFNQNFPENTTLVEYVWIDGTGQGIRSKTRVYNQKISSIEDLDWWTYDGSSTKQAETHSSEIYLKPVTLIKDPLRKQNSYIVWCEGYTSDRITPAQGNFRPLCQKIMQEAKEFKPWFGLEQEYFFLERIGSTGWWPLGWPKGAFPSPQGRYYCSSGPSNAFGRIITEIHLRACIAAGIKMAGLNAESAPSQWEFQIGIAEGIEAGDHLWLARYLLTRIGEDYDVDISFQPKPITGNWAGSGCHVNFSTEASRAENGIDVLLKEFLPQLEKSHAEHLEVYGEENNKRLTGRHETALLSVFSYAEGHRGTSVRIPVLTTEVRRGYLEDRRPASNIDPYLATAILVDTCCLNGKYRNEILDSYRSFLKFKNTE